MTRDDERDQPRELLGPEWTIFSHPSQPPDPVGACLATRWPTGEPRTLDLQVGAEDEGLPWAAALAVEVTLPAPIGTVLIVHHKPNWQLTAEAIRERQALATARWIEELIIDRPDLPVVVLGDFDAAPDAASVRFWTGRQSVDGFSVRYEDAWATVRPGEEGHTFSPRNPLVTAGEMKLERGRRIDYVLVRSGIHGPLLDIADCWIAFDAPEGDTWPSDHFGLIAELTRPPAPPGAWS